MKNYYFVCFSFLFLFFGCSKSSLPVYPVKSVSNWPDDSNPQYFDSISKVSYEVQRDENNIYLHLTTKELASQLKIMRHGLSIWLDPSASKKENQGFVFPMPMPDSLLQKGMGMRGEGRQENNNQGSNRQQGTTTPDQFQQRILQRAYKRYTELPKELQLIGFEAKNQKKVITLGKDPSDIQVDLEIDSSNQFNYFAVIPIKKIYANVLKKSDQISIGIVSGYLQMGENSMPSGGFSPGSNPSSENNQQTGSDRRAIMIKMFEQMSTPVQIWFNIDLSKSK